MTFEPSRPSLVHFIPRNPAVDSQTIEVPTQFLFHCGNAYEEDGRIIMGTVRNWFMSSIYSFLDVAESDTMVLSSSGPLVKQVWKSINYEKDVAPTRLTRYTFEFKEAKWTFVEKRRLSEQCIEFPSVNPSVSCSKVLLCLLIINVMSYSIGICITPEVLFLRGPAHRKASLNMTPY